MVLIQRCIRVDYTENRWFDYKFRFDSKIAKFDSTIKDWQISSVADYFRNTNLCFVIVKVEPIISNLNCFYQENSCSWDLKYQVKKKWLWPVCGAYAKENKIYCRCSDKYYWWPKYLKKYVKKTLDVEVFYW